MSSSDVGGLGARVRAARVRRGWSREALAAAAGVSFAAVVQIESGRRAEPRISTVASIAAALDLSVDYLIGRPLAKAPLWTHCAFFYDSDEEFVSHAVPFILAGLERDEAVVAVTTTARLRKLQERLGASATKVELMESSGWYTAPDEVLARYRELLSDQVAAGRTWVRLVGEPVWKGRTAAQTEAWIRYEALANLMLGNAPATVLCPYNRRAVPEAALAAARHTHPYVLRDDAIVNNDDGQDSAEFLLN